MDGPTLSVKGNTFREKVESVWGSTKERGRYYYFEGPANSGPDYKYQGPRQKREKKRKKILTGEIQYPQTSKMTRARCAVRVT